MSAEADERENPYLSARRTWNGVLESEASSRRLWQIVALGSLTLAIGALGGLIAIASQSKIVPYVVALNGRGEVAASGIAVPARASGLVVHATLAQFISDARMVTVDTALQRKAILWLYAHLSAETPATAKINAWLKASGSNPFARSQKELVSVDINSVLQMSQDTWQVDWTETATDTHGEPVSDPTKWRAVLTVFSAAAGGQQSEADVEANPLGVYVRDFSWSQLQ
jgi:type IV secretion system protein TrbF